MKNRILPICFFASLFFAFTACQKESVSTNIPSQPQTPEDYLNGLGLSVFFQYDYQNEATGEYFGWFVDNTGAVKTYQLQSAAEASALGETGTWTPEQLRRLYNWAKDTRYRLAAGDLVPMVRRIRAASEGRISDRVDNNDRTGRGTFRAFLLEKRQVQQQENGGAQGGCNSSHSNGNQYPATVEEVKLVTLKINGSYDQENLSEDARAITRWLEGIADSAGL
ncbi:MAG: hypothetical protein H6577_07700 [Lewinellaceae bacterium]|nr:hypothetical protein [Saprospiraceae bacterium]MCB9337997.1 hypothetical protein [Lewinellaceae bacterium]